MKKKSKKNKSLFTVLIAILLLSSYWFTEQIAVTELPRSDQPVALYSNQTRQDLQQTFQQAILEAKKSVLLLVYSLSDEVIIGALRHKAESGIPVKVIFDGRSTPFADRKLGPKVEVLKRFGEGLMHMKMLVIDERQVWIGSANMTTDSLRMHGNLVVAFDSPELAKAIKIKADSILEEGRSAKYASQEFIFKDQKMELWFLPSSENGIARLKKIITSAEKTLRVAMFTWTHMDLAKAVVEAAKRGVQTEVVVDHYSGKGAGSAIVKYLKKNGIPVEMSAGGSLLHHKFLYVDSKVLVNGSTNWTKAAFTQNDDCFIVLSDLNELQRDSMDTLWKVIKNEVAR